MIYFLAKRGYQYTWRRCLEQSYSLNDATIRKELFERISLLPYEDLFSQHSLKPGTYVFGDLERLTVEETERAAIYWQTLADAGPSFRVFNHPIASMRRYELLRHLYDAGINNFNVQRLTEPLKLERFPVFIRKESDHRKSDVSPLLRDRAEVEKTIAEMIDVGKNRDDKIITEYLDTRGDSEEFHRYSALLASGNVMVISRDHHTDWQVKSRGPILYERTQSSSGEYSDHHTTLQEIFRLARIDFGRVDYAVVDDRIQVFEINTNPNIGGVQYLLDVARILDHPANGQSRVTVSRQYIPPKAEPAKKGRAFQFSYRLHLLLRRLGLLKYEDNLLKLGHTLKKTFVRRS